ncbi:MAG: ABC transporter substrate-binding protein [Actinomycetota bacterium]
MRRHRLRWLAAVLVTLSACGGTTTTTVGSIAAGGGDPSAFPVVVRGVTIPTLPQRIVSGSATHTEILFGLGAGPKVIATDDFSDYPVEAASLPHFDAFNPSVEGIAGMDPDLVILAFDPGDVAAGLDALGIPTIVFDAPATLEDAYRQFEEVGTATGFAGQGRQLATTTRAEVERLTAGLAELTDPLTYYHELDATFFSIGSDTFLGSIYGLVGLASIADAAGGGYPQLSAEFIVSADPEFIFLGDADCCGENAETVAARPGWGSLRAVTTGRVIAVDEALSSRWGPRLVELVRFLVDTVGGEEG